MRIRNTAKQMAVYESRSGAVKSIRPLFLTVKKINLWSSECENKHTSFRNVPKITKLTVLPERRALNLLLSSMSLVRCRCYWHLRYFWRHTEADSWRSILSGFFWGRTGLLLESSRLTVAGVAQACTVYRHRVQSLSGESLMSQRYATV